MINYLDRTVLGIAAPFLTKDLGLTRGADGAGVLGVLVELRAAADSRRHLPRSVRHAASPTSSPSSFWSLFTALMGVVRSLNGADPDADRRRHLRSAVLSGQQPDPGDLVSAARAGARELDLFVRPVRRARLSQRAAVLDHPAVRLARPVLHRRRPRRRVRRRLVGALSQSGREPTVEPGGARLHRGGRRRRVQGRSRSRSSGATSARCCGTARCSARRSASSAATRRRSSSSPGFRPIS